MDKKVILKDLNFYLRAVGISLVIIELQLLFPDHPLVTTYLNEILISSAVAFVGSIALITRLGFNVMKIKENDFVKYSLSFFIEKISGCFFFMFGFCSAMMIACALHGNQEIVGIYLILGMFGLIYGSATRFLNEKLQISGYLT